MIVPQHPVKNSKHRDNLAMQLLAHPSSFGARYLEIYPVESISAKIGKVNIDTNSLNLSPLTD